ncbi:tRNA pseudouridine(13) synthase TruD [Candidatus Woesearchaeota archaeon]|nr:tRNA pseudouridine(13) synthase TruD [Candidatus Woesearchaeota archaeon]
MYKIKQIPEDFVVNEELKLKFSKGNYYYFSLKKINLTTEQSIEKIAKILNLPRKNIGCAGNKDKKAVTTQTISINSSKQLEKFKLVKPDLQLSYIGKGDLPISLGDLTKNHFEIIVRGIIKKPNPISGIPNYFDEQRFSKNNAKIGRLIVKKEFATAKKLLEQNNHHNFEEHLTKNPTDYVGAMRKISKKILMLYIHSYQSLLFNEMLNDYIKYHKHKTINTNFGELSFPLEKIKQSKFPLIGFMTKENKIVKDILKKENLILRDFIIRQLPNLSQEGQIRECFVDLTNLKISNLQQDELNKGKKKIKLTFSLPKGSYATMVIKSLFL